MHIDTRPSHFLFTLLILTFIHSVTSQPIKTNKWIKPDPFEDLNPLGTWKTLEKESQSFFPTPSHVNHNHIQNPTWRPTSHDNEATERVGPNHSYTKGTPPPGIPAVPVVSVLLPTTDKLQKHYSEYMNITPGPKTELEGISTNAIASDRQNRYNEFLRNMHIKNAIHQEHGETTSMAFSASSSGHTVSFFAYRISIPTLRFNFSSLAGYPFPGVVTTVIILLVLVWIAIITIGLVELGNYIWIRRRQADIGDARGDEEQSVELDELTKIPISVVAIPSDRSLVANESEPVHHRPGDSDVDSESDDDDYRIF
ncbi:unnamed protein product [Penicillium salamii]|uniref:ATPase, vacuolar ER assembly factor, Vma12 n=1 Tax=Penicillium salamii TaxID=1612424 RepID=A0A9W4NWM2_9EURO|nr:unnamed protein product [Penicillium salamii]CAG8029220.1 unnamed protein product [Penicillium salamii]CAG8174149.1 unnamed protein product [Penicillium salamii]CAG8191936.1 unnamed protein product [Penicillium salamii]CAG8217217.1 unnamed protein product [Penicillium salamii]